MADHLGVLNMPMAALKRSATVTSFDPMALLPALAMVTERLGLIATGSTTFDAPYHVARPLCLSGSRQRRARAGWNIVTTSNPEISAELWPRRAYGARRTLPACPASSSTSSPASGIPGLTTPSSATSRTASFSIPSGCTCLNHKGEYFKVRGPR